MDRRNFTKGILGMGAILLAGPSAVAGVRYLYELVKKYEALPSIRLVGVGSAGCRAVKGLIGRHFNASDCLLISRERSDMERAEGANRIFLQEMEQVSSCASCGDEGPALMIARVFQSYEKAILTAFRDADLIIIMAGMGWITGTMAAPLTAKICRGSNAPVMAAVTAPFAWEGQLPAENAAFGISELRKYADRVVVHSLEQMIPSRQKTISIREAYDLGVNRMQQTALSLACSRRLFPFLMGFINAIRNHGGDMQ
jgi:cell division protein FtsZ